jgi:nucleotide-binding universal stress UspA family protein
MFDVPMMPSFADMEQTRLKEMQEFIDQEVSDPNVKIEKIIRHGRPFIEILAVAREENVDLIVTATHGRGGLEHVLFGSVAEKVVRKAPCPVLSIRLPGHEFSIP